MTIILLWAQVDDACTKKRLATWLSIGYVENTSVLVNCAQCIQRVVRTEQWAAGYLKQARPGMQADFGDKQ